MRSSAFRSSFSSFSEVGLNTSLISTTESTRCAACQLQTSSSGGFAAEPIAIMSLKGFDWNENEAPESASPPDPPGASDVESDGGKGKVARRAPRTTEEFIQFATRIRAEAARLVSTSWLKWTPEPARAYPKYRQAGAEYHRHGLPTKRCPGADRADF